MYFSGVSVRRGGVAFVPGHLSEKARVATTRSGGTDGLRGKNGEARVINRTHSSALPKCSEHLQFTLVVLHTYPPFSYI